MFWETRCVRDGADRESGGLVEHVERAFVARGYRRQDDSSLTLEPYDVGQTVNQRFPSRPQELTFGSTVNKRLQRLAVVAIHHAYQCGVDPSPGLYRVKTTDDDIELHVVRLVLVLDLAKVS